MPNRRHRNYAPEGRPGLFTELFTVRYTVVTIGSAPGYGHCGSSSSSTRQEGGGGGCGGVLERRKFSPGIPEVISITLKDTLQGIGTERCSARRSPVQVFFERPMPSWHHLMPKPLAQKPPPDRPLLLGSRPLGRQSTGQPRKENMGSLFELWLQCRSGSTEMPR